MALALIFVCNPIVPKGAASQLAALIYETPSPKDSELNLLAIWYFSKLGSWRGHGASHCGSDWE
jgi:hypothetical protein